MKNKYALFFLIFFLGFSFSGCALRSDTDANKNDSSSVVVNSANEETANETTNTSSTNTNTNLNTNTVVSDTSVSNYVQLDGSTAKTATFVFSSELKESDLTGENILHCIVSTSAGEAGEGEPECTQVNKNNDFTISYTPDTKTLVITDTSDDDKWGEGAGAFRIGCASCVSAIKFQNIHTSSGTPLDTKIVNVY